MCIVKFGSFCAGGSTALRTKINAQTNLLQLFRRQIFRQAGPHIYVRKVSPPPTGVVACRPGVLVRRESLFSRIAKRCPTAAVRSCSYRGCRNPSRVPVDFLTVSIYWKGCKSLGAEPETPIPPTPKGSESGPNQPRNGGLSVRYAKGSASSGQACLAVVKA